MREKIEEKREKVGVRERESATLIKGKGVVYLVLGIDQNGQRGQVGQGE